MTVNGIYIKKIPNNLLIDLAPYSYIKMCENRERIRRFVYGAKYLVSYGDLIYVVNFEIYDKAK